MAIKVYKPTTNARRNMSVTDYSKLSKVEVNKGLVSKGFTSIAAVRNAFTEAIAAVKNAQTSSGPSSPISGPSTGSVISKVEMPAQTVNPYENFAPFNDISGVEWAKEAITALYMKNIISGYEDGTFKPDININRAEVVTVVNRATGRTPDKEYISENYTKLDRFTDVKDSNAWYFFEVHEASNDHIAYETSNSENWLK